MAVAILDYNSHSTGFKFNLKGVAVRFHLFSVLSCDLYLSMNLICPFSPYQIGNPLLRLDHDSPATYEFFWSHGMISDEIDIAITKECDFDDYVFASPHNVSVSCNKALSEANRIVGEYVNDYDVILDVCYPSIVEQELRLRKIVFS